MSQGIINTLLRQTTKKISQTITRPADTTAYTANDVVGTATTNITFENVSSKVGRAFIITSATLEVHVGTVPAGMGSFRLHLYDSNPTVIADNSAYNLPSADRAKHIGIIIFSTPVDFGDTLWSQSDGINVTGKLADTSTTLYGILETASAYTPSSATVKKITLYAVEV